MTPHSSRANKTRGARDAILAAATNAWRKSTNRGCVTRTDYGQQPSTVGHLFTCPPYFYGLRGDVYIWGELGQNFSEAPLSDSRWRLQPQLEAAWAAAVGEQLTASSVPIYVKRFDPGSGMSAGMVLPAWWHGMGLPILIDRFCATSGEY